MLNASVATTCLTVIADGMDQAKFKCPRVRTTASKLFSRLRRPTLHVAATWCHGKELFFSVSDEDLCKNSEAQMEQLSRALSSVFSDLAFLPPGLCLQQDNTYREGKNRFMANYLTLLVALGSFRRAMANFLRPGHSV